MSEQPCYSSLEDKLRIFPAVVVPNIHALAVAGANGDVLHTWLNSAALSWIPRGLFQLMALHTLARKGIYRVPFPYNCDPPQAVEITVTEGGDCDQWATVLLAALITLGYPGRLLTFGRDHDPYEHVAVAAMHGGVWYCLDPKGDDNGLDFGAMDYSYPNLQVWDGPPELE